MPDQSLPPAFVTVDARAGELAEYCLQLSCRCLRFSNLPFRVLANRFGADRTVRDILSRLRCSACGREPDSAMIVENAAGRAHGRMGAPEGWEVGLIRDRTAWCALRPGEHPAWRSRE